MTRVIFVAVVVAGAWTIGIVFSLVAAWAAVATDVSVYADIMRHVPPSASQVSWWTRNAPDDISRDLRQVEQARSAWVKLQMFIAVSSGNVEFGESGYAARSTVNGDAPVFDRVLAIEAGWPFTCIRGVRYEYQVPPGSLVTGIEGAGLANPSRVRYDKAVPLGGMSKLVAQRHESRWGDGLGRFLPTGIIWVGLLLNGAMYGGIVSSPVVCAWQVGRLIRRWRRQRSTRYMSCDFLLNEVGEKGEEKGKKRGSGVID